MLNKDKNKINNNDPCYLCGAKELKIIRTKLRHGIRRNVFECEECGIVYLESVQQDLKDFYTEEYRKLYTPVIGSALNSQELFDICLTYQKDRIDELKHVLDQRNSSMSVVLPAHSCIQ